MKYLKLFEDHVWRKEKEAFDNIFEIDLNKVLSRFRKTPYNIDGYLMTMLEGEYITYHCEDCGKNHSGIVIQVDFETKGDEKDGIDDDLKYSLHNRIVLDSDENDEQSWDHLVSYDKPIIVDKRKKVQKRFDL